jgi:hypothetical protein
MTIAAYQTLYESSIAFGMRKALQAEQGKSDMETRIRELEEEKRNLEQQCVELKMKCEAIEKRESERRAVEERKHAEEVAFLKKTNLQLKVRHAMKRAQKNPRKSCHELRMTMLFNAYNLFLFSFRPKTHPGMIFTITDSAGGHPVAAKEIDVSNAMKVCKSNFFLTRSRLIRFLAAAVCLSKGWRWPAPTAASGTRRSQAVARQAAGASSSRPCRASGGGLQRSSWTRQNSPP